MNAWFLRLLLLIPIGLLAWWLIADHGEGGGASDVVRQEAPSEERPPSLRGHPLGDAPAASDSTDPASIAGGTEEGGDAAYATSLPASSGPSFDITWCDAETGRDLGGVAHLGTRSTAHGRLTFGVNPRVPVGYLAWDDKTWRTPEVPWVKHVKVVYPLRREVEAEVHLRREDGRAPEMARLTWSAAGRRAGQVRATSTPVRLDDIPHFPGALLQVSVRDGDAAGTGWVVIPPRSDDLLRVEMSLEIDDFVIKDAEISDHVETDNDLPYEESLGQGPPPTGSLEVWVARRDAGVAAGIRVLRDGTSATTDARGLVRYDDVMAGEHTVSLAQPGMVPTTTTAQVRAGRTELVRLIERAGATLDVQVVDQQGQDLAFASVYVAQPSGVTWLDIDGDVQRLDPFTDERGRRRLEHVEPGKVRVGAQWAGTWGWKNVEVEEGAVTPVRVVINLSR